MTALPPAVLNFPQEFTFVHIIDLLEHFATLRRGGERTSLGIGVDPDQEALRLVSNFDMAFHGAAIEGWVTRDSAVDFAPTLMVNFFGLGGSHGPLPEAYIEIVLERVLARDYSAADFLDIFHHRLLSLLYRVDSTLRIASPFKSPIESPHIEAFRALLGIQNNANSNAAELDAVLLANAGLIAQQRHSLDGLLTLLQTYFNTSVTGCEFTGRWICLPEELQTVLGEGGQNTCLREDALIGKCAWDQSGAIALRFVGLSLQKYLSFLPGGDCHDILAKICAYYVGPDIVCEVQLEINEADMQVQQAATIGHTSCLLGYTSWLGPLALSDSARTANIFFNQ